MKIRRATMALAVAGALTLGACTSGPDTEEGSGSGSGSSEESGSDGEQSSDGEASSDDAAATSGGGGETAGGASGDTAKADLGEVTTVQDTISFSSGAEEYNAYNGDTAGTNSTYNSVVNGQLGTGFWYWGTDGTVYPNEFFGTYEKTSDDPLTVEYTISDEAVWQDGTPVTANDYLLTWASTNPEAIFGAADEEGSNEGKFNPVSDWSKYATETPETEPGSKSFTVTYPEPYPDWEIAVSGALPSHIAAQQSGLEPDELAQAILDGDAETVNKVADFWNEGWLFPNYQVEDESLVPSMGPYSLQGASWQSGTQLTLVPNEKYFGPAPATSDLMFRFAAPETHVQGLGNGDINVIEPQATVDTVQQIENLGEQVKMETGSSFTWEHLDFNFGEGSIFPDDEGGLAAREAFAMCVPRQGIVDSLIKPINPDAQVMNAREFFPFEDTYEQAVSESYDGRYDEVDIEGAKAKFEEAGLEDGVTLRIGYSAPNQRRTDEIAAIKASCDQVGFKVEDAGAADFFESGGPLESGDWEVALFAWAGSGQKASGAPIYSTNGPQNYGGFSNSEVDDLWNSVGTTVDDEQIMKDKIQIEKLLWDELYGIPLFAHPEVVGYDATLENVRQTVVQTGITWNAEQWVRAQ